MDGTDVFLLILAVTLVPIGGLCAAGDAAITMVSRARVEEMQRDGRRSAGALLQIDSRRMTAIFDKLRDEGVTDIAPYLEGHPDLVDHSRQIVQVTDANRDALRLFGASRPEDLIGAVDFLFAESADTAKRVITAHFEGKRQQRHRRDRKTQKKLAGGSEEAAAVAELVDAKHPVGAEFHGQSEQIAEAGQYKKRQSQGS